MKKNKKIIFIVLMLTLVTMLSACVDGNNLSEEGSVDKVRLSISVGDSSGIITLVDSRASRDLVERLKAQAITLSFRDFNSSEKIAYFDSPLNTDGDNGCDPKVGDLTIYTPWGNLAVFYKDTSGFSKALVLLGSLDAAGIELLSKQSSDFEATIALIQG